MKKQVFLRLSGVVHHTVWDVLERELSNLGFTLKGFPLNVEIDYGYSNGYSENPFTLKAILIPDQFEQFGKVLALLAKNNVSCELCFSANKPSGDFKITEK